MRHTCLDLGDPLRTVARIEAMPALLQMLSEASGLGFIGVARVTDDSWTCCAVHDAIEHGLTVGTQLDVGTTFCAQFRGSRQPIVMEHASIDPVYKDHPTPKIYGYESFVAVPILAVDDECFGGLFGVHPLPKKLPRHVVELFNGVALVISLQLAAVRQRQDDAETIATRRFMSALANDLRRPVDAICEAAELLEKKCQDASSKELAAGVERRARRVSVLADHMRDVTACSMGKVMELRLEAAELDSPLNRMLSEVRHANPHRRIIANISVRASVLCDPSRISQLTSLLLESALAQAEPMGPVSLAATYEDDGLSIDVWNDGQELSPERLDRVFAPDWQPDSANAPMDSLSLHVCRLIADAHNGSIAVTSNTTDGTQFSLRVPAKAREAVKVSSLAQRLIAETGDGRLS